MIQSAEALARVIESARTHDAVAVDTEFVWERTYYPQLCLVQLAFPDGAVHLVDTLAVDDLSALGLLLADASVTKILHDAEQDLTILRRATGSAPLNVFDTQRAGGFVGLTSTLSLQNLLREVLGVQLAKTETRTDWSRRPLSDSQLEYAEDDVRHLVPLLRELRRRAEAAGRLAWLEEEMAAYDDPTRYDERDPREDPPRVSGTGRMTGRERTVLGALVAWREEEARRVDRPRRRVLDDKTIVDLARRPPAPDDRLESHRALTERQASRYGTGLRAALAEGAAAPVEERSYPPADDALEARLNVALGVLKGEGQATGIDPALVANRADVEALLRAAPDADPADHAMLRGWRRAFIGEGLLRLASGDAAVVVEGDDRVPRLASRNGHGGEF